MKTIASITVKCFILGVYLWMISTQVNSGNPIGSILGLTVVVVLFYNIYLRQEYRAIRQHMKDAQHFAQKYWDSFDVYE